MERSKSLIRGTSGGEFMIKKILIAIAVVVAAVFAIAAFQPADYKIERTITIGAPAEKVFPHVNSQKNVSAWSPWLELDPNALITYEGPAEGVGSISTWKGNKDIGAGKSTITESRPNEYVKFKLDFYEPMVSEAEGEYILKSEAGQTTMTWTMFGKNTFIGRVMCMFMSMDKMVGGTFEKGLNNLKTLVESQKQDL